MAGIMSRIATSKHPNSQRPTRCAAAHTDLHYGLASQVRSQLFSAVLEAAQSQHASSLDTTLASLVDSEPLLLQQSAESVLLEYAVQYR